MSHTEEEAIGVEVKEKVSRAPFSLCPSHQKDQSQDMFSDLSASVVGVVKFTDPPAQIGYLGAVLDQAIL